MFNNRESQYKKCETLIRTLTKSLEIDKNSSEWAHHESNSYVHVYMLNETFKENSDVSIDMKSQLLEKLVEWLETSLDSSFFESQILVDTRPKASQECIVDIQKMRVSQEQETSVPSKLLKRKRGKRKQANPVAKEIDTSSSDEQFNVQKYRRMMELVDKHRSNFLSSDESLDREADIIEHEMKEVHTKLGNWSKRDKVVMVIKLICKFSHYLSLSDFTKLMTEVVQMLPLSERCEEHQQLQYSNVVICFMELSIEIFKIYRWRNQYNDECIDFMTQLWAYNTLIVLMFSQIDENVMTCSRIYSHYETCLNLMQANFVEYLYIISCDCYDIDTVYIEHFLNVENLYWFNFPTMANDIIRSANTLQLTIQYPKPLFYRVIFTFLIVHFRQVEKSILTDFFLSAQSGIQKSVSLGEVCYITKNVSVHDLVEILAHHAGECDFMFSTHNDQVFDTNTDVIQLSSKIVEKLSQCHHDARINFQLWSNMIKNLIKCHINLMNNSKDKPDFPNANKVFFDLFEAILKNLLKESCSQMRYSKHLVFLLKQFGKLIMYLKENEFLIFLKPIKEYRVVFASSEYNEKVAEFMGSCFQFSQKYDNATLKANVANTVMLMAYDTFSTQHSRNRKIQNIRFYCKTMFDFFVTEMELATTSEDLKTRFPPEYFSMASQSRSYIDMHCSITPHVEKDFLEAKALCIPYYLLNIHLFLPLIDDQIDDNNHIKFEQSLLDVVKSVINTSAKNTVVHCLMTVIDRIMQLKNSKFNHANKNQLCDDLFMAIHSVVMNYMLDPIIFSLPQANDLKKLMFQTSHVFLSLSVFDKSIIDYLADTKGDFNWIINDLKHMCDPGQVVPFLLFKYNNASANSQAKRRFLDVLNHCATYYPTPNFFKDSLREPNVIEHCINIIEGVSMSTWFNLPKLLMSNIFVFVLGYTIRVSLNSDHKSFVVHCSQSNSKPTSRKSRDCFINPSKWHILTISLKTTTEGVLSVMVSVNENFDIFELDGSSFTRKKMFKNLRTTNIRWDMTDIFHTPVIIHSGVFDYRKLAAIMAMGPQSRINTNSSNVQALPVCRFNMLRIFNNNERVKYFFDDTILQEIQENVIHVIDKFCVEKTQRSNFYQQFIASGGVPSFLLMYGRSLVDRADVSTQNSNLKIILELMSKPCVDSERWPISSAKSVLAFLFKSDLVIFNEETLEILICHCFEIPYSTKIEDTEPFQQQKIKVDSFELFLNKLTKAYVRDVEILENLVKDWDLWVNRSELFTKLIKCLACSVQMHNSYNTWHMVSLVKHIMKTLTTIFEQVPDWNVEGNELAVEVGKLCGTILKSLSGQEKIDCAHELWNCIVLLKPASDMYVENGQVTHQHWFNEEAVNHEIGILAEIKLPLIPPIPYIVVTENMQKHLEDHDTDEDINSEYSSDNEEMEEVYRNNAKIIHLPTDIHDDVSRHVGTTSLNEMHWERSWDVLLQKEIYDILIELVKLSPDDERIGSESLGVEILIVLLTKQNDVLIITRIMKLFAALMNYCTSLEDQFLICKSEQFKILAAQLRGRSLDLSVSNSLFSILFREEVDISAGLDAAHVMNFEPNLISCHVLDALLVVFEESLNVDDAGEMFIHTCAALSIIYENNIQLALALTDRKLEEVMVNVMYQLCAYPQIANSKDTILMKKTSWMSFAKKIVNISSVTSSQSYYQCAEKLIKLIIVAHVQETSDGNEKPDIVIQENIHRVLCTLLLELLKNLIGTADVDSQNHRSASASNTPIGSNGMNTPEELDYFFVNESHHRWTDGLVKFKDKLKQMFQGMSPNLKCPYSKKKLQPLTPLEMTARVKRVLSICNMFYTVCRPPVDSFDEDESLQHEFFYNLTRIALEDSSILTTQFFASVQSDARKHLASFVASVLFDYPRKMGRTEHELYYHVDARKMRVLNKLMISTPTNRVKSILSMNVNVEYCIQSGLIEEIMSRESDDELRQMCIEFLRLFDFQYYTYAMNVGNFNADTIQLLSSDYEMAAQFCNEERKSSIRELLCLCTGWRIQQQSEDYTTIVNEITHHAVMMQGDARKVGYARLSRHFKGEAMAKNEFIKYKDVLGHIGQKPKTVQEFPIMRVSAVQGPRGERIRFDDTTNVLPEKFHTIQCDTFRPLATLWDSIQMIHANRSVKEGSLFTCDCTLVLNGSYFDGVLVFTDVNIYFLPEKEFQKNMHIEIAYNTILTVHYRRFELKNLAFELFMDNHSTWFFAVKYYEDRQQAVSIITDRSKCKIAEPSDIIQYSKDWENGKITNFEYLMILNAYAGRTYHDFMQYPIMPHIISNLDQDSIDLLDPENYRVLSKPIAVQRESMEERYRNCYDMLAESMNNDTHTAPYHYASLHSNLATVSYYLVRLLPHAKIAIDFQDGSFDVPDRIFHNISSTFRLAAGGSATDYKELVPEMFTTSEVFLNMNKMNFGVCQNGEIVNDVVLPPWCYAISSDNEFLKDEQNMRRFKADLFIIAQRHALESREVEKNLHEWIDLIFGYKQTGIHARQALNVYHPAVYPESIPPDHTDPILYAAHKANVRNIGQVPIQLFHRPHVARHVEYSTEDEFIIGGIRGLGVGNQIYQQPLELKEIDLHEEMKLNRIKNIFSEKQYNEIQHSSTFFPVRNDFRNINVTFDDYTITVTDIKLKQSISKRQTAKIKLVQHYPESPYVASMSTNGVIDFYKIVQKNFFGEFTLEVVFDGSIHATYGTFRDLDMCHSFNGVFTISNSMLNKQYISVWDLYEKRLIRCTEIAAERLEIFGVLKHSGELIVADKSTYSEDVDSSMICKFSINGRLMMKQTYNFGFINGSLSQMKPGEGIPMLANICTDFTIRIFETITLSCVRSIDFSKLIKNPPHRIEYDTDRNLMIYDDSKNKWKFTRKNN